MAIMAEAGQANGELSILLYLACILPSNNKRKYQKKRSWVHVFTFFSHLGGNQKNLASVGSGLVAKATAFDFLFVDKCG